MQRVELKSSESPSGSEPDKKPKKKKAEKDTTETKEKKDKEKDSRKKDKEKETKNKKQKVDAEQEFDSLFGGGPRDPNEDDDGDDGVMDSDETKPPKKKPTARSRVNKEKTSKKEKKEEKKKNRRGKKNDDGLEGETTPVADPCEPVAETQLDTPSPYNRPELRRLDPLDEKVLQAMELADAAELRAKQKRAQALQNSRKGLASHVLVVLGQWEKPPNSNHILKSSRSNHKPPKVTLQGSQFCKYFMGLKQSNPEGHEYYFC